MTMSDEWKLEKAFWEAQPRAAMYNLETVGRAYMTYETLIEVERLPNGRFDYFGDWVRAEDYRRDVEELEKQVSFYKNLALAPAEMLEEDQAVLDAFGRLSEEELDRLSKSGNVEQDLAAAEYARRKIMVELKEAREELALLKR